MVRVRDAPAEPAGVPLDLRQTAEPVVELLGPPKVLVGDVHIVGQVIVLVGCIVSCWVSDFGSPAEIVVLISHDIVHRIGYVENVSCGDVVAV